ncbi:MAG: PilZ domain-containing protein [Bryobacterales bacterium]|nr:PilZ domain-containing protein [Bryobacterales bacterium]
MERRVEARQASRETALVKKLSGSEEAMEAGVADISARGLKLRVPVRMEVNTPVSVRMGDRILLGDVCYCREAEEVVGGADAIVARSDPEPDEAVARGGRSGRGVTKPGHLMGE